MYWEKEIETMSHEKLEELQLQRLRESVKNASASYYYNNLFERIGFRHENITSLDDLKKIPFTTKDDLREHWPYGFLAVSKDELVRMHSSSGTTGRATVIFHTQHD
ncbi:MAG: phenylacetate--CoA ligase, partial [Thermodesulfobacteriota bacterium]|nr:phenylacetate--CoA ligase [Thermodesulfobacteriota bacterium]